LSDVGKDRLASSLAIATSLVVFTTACGGSALPAPAGAHPHDSGASLVDATLPFEASTVVDAGADAEVGADASYPLQDSGPSPGDAGVDSTGAPTVCLLDAATPVSDAMTCPLGSVAFHLNVAPGWLVATAGLGCSWLSLSCASSGSLPLSVPDIAPVDCRDCASSLPQFPIGCPVPSPTGDSGPSTFDQGWNGVYYTGGPVCGSTPDLRPCATPLCAPAGRYVASMCGCRLADSGPCINTCTEVPFDYPSSRTVVGTLQ
jgi:hypothetical protein